MHDERTAARFWAKVDKSGDCWLWTARRFPNGYGNFYVSRARPSALAHRVAYELVVGPIPDGLDLDHVAARGCRHRHCVNPAHLEPVTHRENDLRGNGVSGLNARKTHCPKGHPLSGENLYEHRGRRQCRTCRRAHTARSNARVAAARAARRAARAAAGSATG